MTPEELEGIEARANVLPEMQIKKDLLRCCRELRQRLRIEGHQKPRPTTFMAPAPVTVNVTTNAKPRSRRKKKAD